MPNWNTNNLEVRSKDPALIKQFVIALESDGLFQALKPNPTGNWDYAWSVENWGVKWDVRGEDIQVIQIDDDRVLISFDTAWGPPITFYEYLEELGFEVEGMYFEPGLNFCGIYSHGFDDYYELSGLSAEDIRKSIPEDIDMCFAISEYIEDMENWND